MRPRLQPDAFLRTYVGDRGWGHVLVRRAPGRRVTLDAVERAIVEAMDGEHDEAALAREASFATSRAVTAERVLELARRLRAAGALVDGEGDVVGPPRPTPGLELAELPASEAEALRLSLLPGAAFRCGGQGGCCRLYSLVMLRPADVAGLVDAYGRDGHLPGGLTLDSALSRPRPLGPGDEDEFAIASIDGACMVLEPGGTCGVHRLLGPLRKPSGCLAFPLRDVVCGEELAVGLAPECRCVIDSDGDPAADDLRPRAEDLLARRSALRRVERVAARVPLRAGVEVPRAEYAAWRGAAGARLSATGDAVAWALDEAARLEGLAGGPPLSSFAARSGPILATVAEWLDAEARDMALVYSAADLQRRLFAWMAAAAARLRDESAAQRVPVEPAVGEHLAAVQALHTHDLLRASDLSSGLLSLAVRLLLARAATEGVPAEGAPAELLPVAGVVYLARSSWLGQLLDEAGRRLAASLGGTAQE